MAIYGFRAWGLEFRDDANAGTNIVTKAHDPTRNVSYIGTTEAYLDHAFGAL